MKKLLIFTFLVFCSFLLAWNSPNNGELFTMNDLVTLCDSVSWDESENEYLVNCDINIMPQDTLLIEAGSEVQFRMIHLSTGGAVLVSLNINGTLLSLGTEENNIKLHNDEYAYTHNWKGIHFIDTSVNGESKIEHTIIERASRIGPNSSILCHNSSPEFNNCTISLIGSPESSCRANVITCFGTSYPQFNYCEFSNIVGGVSLCRESASAGQDTINYPSPTFYNCNIYNSVNGFYVNTGNGVYTDGEYFVNGGFLDNCYLEKNNFEADISLGDNIDLVGDGVCNTTSTDPDYPTFYLIDGVVNPRATPEFTDIDDVLVLDKNQSFILDQSYPNPILRNNTRGKSIIISFEILDNNENFSLDIYNIRGQKIRTIFKEREFNKGKHQKTWNCRNENEEEISSGVYFYKMTSNQKSLTKKLIILN